MSHDPDALLVAELDGEVVGTLVVGWDGWRYHVYRLAVREDLRRRSIATALLNEAHRRVRAMGATRVDAMLDLANTGAIAFWETAGFARDHDAGRWSLVL